MSQRRKSLKEIQQKCDEAHDNKLVVLGISPVNDEKRYRAVDLFCTQCGNTFVKSVTDSANKNGRCPHCNVEALSYEQVQKNLDNKYGIGRYRIVKPTFVDLNTKCNIYCSDCNSFIYKKPGDLTRGRTLNGCPNCCKNGFKPDEPAIVYFFRILYKSKFYYKIGKTNHNLNYRYSKSVIKRIDKSSVIIKDFKCGRDASDFEKEIKDDLDLQVFRINNEGVLGKDSGYKEELYHSNIKEHKPNYFKSFKKSTVYKKPFDK